MDNNVSKLKWIDDLEVLRVTVQEFKDLLDYSASLPTGVTPGKRWKCLVGSFDHEFVRAGGQPRWVIREYYSVPPKDGREMCGIRQYRPIIRVRAA